VRVQRVRTLIEALDALEETEDSEGTHQLELIERTELGASHENATHRDDDRIENVPRRAPERWARPAVAIHVD
jgi:hypothetical protein